MVKGMAPRRSCSRWPTLIRRSPRTRQGGGSRRGCCDWTVRLPEPGQQRARLPVVFRGALDCRARKITEEMKIAGVKALAELARTDVPDNVLTAYGLETLSWPTT